MHGTHDQDQFGFSLDMSDDGSILAVGATGYDNQVGLVQVFSWSFSSNQYEPRGGLPSSPSSRLVGDSSIPNGNFGRSVSLSADGNVLAVGASQFLSTETHLQKLIGSAYDPSDGYARVYEFDQDSNEWRQRGNDLLGYPSGNGGGQEIGSSIAMSADGTKCLVGLPTLFNSAGDIVSYKYETSAIAKEGGWKPIYIETQGTYKVSISVTTSKTSFTRSLPPSKSPNVMISWGMPSCLSRWNLIVPCLILPT